jgi:hypothetical protein
MVADTLPLPGIIGPASTISELQRRLWGEPAICELCGAEIPGRRWVHTEAGLAEAEVEHFLKTGCKGSLRGPCLSPMPEPPPLRKTWE